jgi:hypothetical protein
MRNFSNLIHFWYEKPISARRLRKNENKIQPIATEVFLLLFVKREKYEVFVLNLIHF